MIISIVNGSNIVSGAIELFSGVISGWKDLLLLEMNKKLKVFFN